MIHGCCATFLGTRYDERYLCCRHNVWCPRKLEDALGGRVLYRFAQVLNRSLSTQFWLSKSRSSVTGSSKKELRAAAMGNPFQTALILSSGFHCPNVREYYLEHRLEAACRRCRVSRVHARTHRPHPRSRWILRKGASAGNLKGPTPPSFRQCAARIVILDKHQR